MSIGFSGAHRTGKTTLAKAVAARLYLPFVETTATAVYEDMGLSPRGDYSFTKRLEIQQRILDAFYAQWHAQGRLFISDRTPLDLMAYTLADVLRETVDDKTDAALEAYMKSCVAVANEQFRALIVVQPGIEIVEDQRKAPGSYGYVQHINALVMGLGIAADFAQIKYFVPKSVTALEMRVLYSIKACAKVLEEPGSGYGHEIIELGSKVLH